MTDEMQAHLDKGRYGTPLLKPDEQRKYLGTFRERCYLSMTLAQMKQPVNQKLLSSHLSSYAGTTILLNGSLPETLQSSYIQLITNAGLPFTIVTPESIDTNDNQAIGLLVVAKEAVNETVIDIEEKYAVKQVPTPEKKEGFWQKWFK